MSYPATTPRQQGSQRRRTSTSDPGILDDADPMTIQQPLQTDGIQDLLEQMDPYGFLADLIDKAKIDVEQKWAKLNIELNVLIDAIDRTEVDSFLCKYTDDEYMLEHLVGRSETYYHDALLYLINKKKQQQSTTRQRQSRQGQVSDNISLEPGILEPIIEAFYEYDKSCVTKQLIKPRSDVHRQRFSPQVSTDPWDSFYAWICAHENDGSIGTSARGEEEDLV